MGGQVSGARNTFSLNSMPYDGLFNENYFRIEAREKELINNLEVSTARVKNPITNEIEQFVGLLIKSKYDGEGIREQIDISLTLDISGSMSGNRLFLAKSAINKLIGKLNEDDNFAFSTFNTKSYCIIPFKSKKEFTQNDEMLINSSVAEGGTNLQPALQGAYEQLAKSQSKNKRIIMVTDVCGFDEQKFVEYFKTVVAKNIGITIIAISEQSDSKMANLVSYSKGCNYYVVRKNEDLERYLVNQFNYICFPHSYDFKVEYLSGNSYIKEMIGSEEDAEVKTKGDNREWKTSETGLYSQDFNKKVQFLLLYFNRIKKILPKPVLATFANFLKYGKKSIIEATSVFPSDVITRETGEHYMNGGLLLLKVENDKEVKYDKNINGILRMKYQDTEGKSYCHEYKVALKDQKEGEYFDNEAIEKGIALYYYGKQYRNIINFNNAIVSEEKLQKGRPNNNEPIQIDLTSNKEVQEKKQIAEKKEQILSYVKEHFHEMKDLDLGALTRYEERVNTIYEAAMKQYNSIINPLPLQQPIQQQQPQENANSAQN